MLAARTKELTTARAPATARMKLRVGTRDFFLLLWGNLFSALMGAGERWILDERRCVGWRWCMRLLLRWGGSL